MKHQDNSDKELQYDFEKRVNKKIQNVIRMEEILRMGIVTPLINPTIELGIYFTTPFSLINNLNEYAKYINFNKVDPTTTQKFKAFPNFTRGVGGNILTLDEKRKKELKRLKKLYKKHINYKN